MARGLWSEGIKVYWPSLEALGMRGSNYRFRGLGFGGLGLSLILYCGLFSNCARLEFLSFRV